MPQKKPRTLTDAQAPSCGALLSGHIHIGTQLCEWVCGAKRCVVVGSDGFQFEEAAGVWKWLGCVDADKFRQ